jgi:signal transduction histidine kinase
MWLMSMFAHQLHDRRSIQLLLSWRWLVLAIGIPISVVIELIEGYSLDLHVLDEIIIDGLLVPFFTWAVLTIAARNIARHYEREETLEQRQQFMQRLAEHREYSDLAHFIVRFPSSLLPIDHASLFVYDRDLARLDFATEWNAASSVDTPMPRYLAAPTVCSACLASDSAQICHTGGCVLALQQQTDASQPEYCLPLAHDQALIGVLRLRYQVGKMPVADHLKFIRTLAPEVALALELSIEDTRQAQRMYREAQIQERRRITHELHDSLAQQLFYLHLSLDQLAGGEALLASDTTQRKVESLRDVAADVYEQVRNNLSILRAWEQADLTEAISRLARVTAHNADLTIAIDVQGDAVWLSPHTCEDIYGVVREALNNVVKHAQAQHVQLDLRWSADHLSISLVDNGVGFDPSQLPNEGHYGLTLMREVIEAMLGEFTIESAPGKGTCLQARIPLQLLEPDLRLSIVRPQPHPALDMVV